MLLQNIIVSVLSRSRTYTSSERFTERKLFYLERGHGQPVILIHGTLNDFRIWQFQIEPFAQKFHVVSYGRRYAYPNQVGEQDLRILIIRFPINRGAIDCVTTWRIATICPVKHTFVKIELQVNWLG